MSKSQLQNELKKRDPFDSTEQEACLNILRTSDLLQNRMGRFFRQYGLTASQYNVLRILRGAGRPIPSLEIAEQMIQVVPAITGLIDRLEAQGMVERQRCAEDRRVVYIKITSRAITLIKSMDKPLNALHDSMLGHLTVSEQQTLIRLMEKARTNL